tara:strand:- start:3472 stop:3930 length:459 start_codon:yes stop_codon:yes gene_type:complete
MADTFLNQERIGLLIWKISNSWQSKLRKILKLHKISLNEYLIIETLYKLNSLNNNLSQVIISKNSGLDISVISINLNILESKNLVKRKTQDNRTKQIILTNTGLKLIKDLIDSINNEEVNFFKILGSENFNFINSLKLLLGKKIRIKAKKND